MYKSLVNINGAYINEERTASLSSKKNSQRIVTNVPNLDYMINFKHLLEKEGISIKVEKETDIINSNAIGSANVEEESMASVSSKDSQRCVTNVPRKPSYPDLDLMKKYF